MSEIVQHNRIYVLTPFPKGSKNAARGLHEGLVLEYGIRWITNSLWKISGWRYENSNEQDHCLVTRISSLAKTRKKGNINVQTYERISNREIISNQRIWWHLLRRHPTCCSLRRGDKVVRQRTRISRVREQMYHEHQVRCHWLLHCPCNWWHRLGWHLMAPMSRILAKMCTEYSRILQYVATATTIKYSHWSPLIRTRDIVA